MKSIYNSATPNNALQRTVTAGAASVAELGRSGAGKMKKRCTWLAVAALTPLAVVGWLSLISIGSAQERDHLPGKINLVPEFQELGLAPRAQKTRNTCSLFAITALADFEYTRSTSRPHKRLSEEFLIWAANEATGLKGDQAMFYEAVHGLNALGICTEELMPYSDTTDAKRKPSSAALADAKVRSAGAGRFNGSNGGISSAPSATPRCSRSRKRWRVATRWHADCAGRKRSGAMKY